jgi:FimV-like protein
MSKTKKILIAVIAAVVLIVGAVGVYLVLNVPMPVNSSADHISLAEKYLLELDYDAAIAEYHTAIEIDPKNVDYYIALAEVYVEMGDIEAAIEVLDEGLEAAEEAEREQIRAVLDRVILKPFEVTAGAITSADPLAAALNSDTLFINDSANFLTNGEETKLLEQMRKVSDDTNWNILIMTFEGRYKGNEAEIYLDEAYYDKFGNSDGLGYIMTSKDDDKVNITVNDYYVTIKAYGNALFPNNTDDIIAAIGTPLEYYDEYNSAVAFLDYCLPYDITTQNTKTYYTQYTFEKILDENTDITDRFPNSAFRKVLRNELKIEDDAPIMSDDVASLTMIRAAGYGITDITGIEYCTSLRQFTCEFNNLSFIPALPSSLIYFDCTDNRLIELPDLPINLKQLKCGSNNLESLPSLPDGLFKLSCSNNNLVSLPELPETLTELKCFSNKLTSLPKIPEALITLICYTNPLSSIPDLPDTLVELDCRFCDINALPVLPTNLKILICFQNNIKTMPELPDKLVELKCSNNYLTVIPELPDSLKILRVHENQLTSLPELPLKLNDFSCSGNNLEVSKIVFKDGSTLLEREAEGKFDYIVY